MRRLRQRNVGSFQAIGRQTCLLQGLLSKAQTKKTLLILLIESFLFFDLILLGVALYRKVKITCPKPLQIFLDVIIFIQW